MTLSSLRSAALAAALASIGLAAHAAEAEPGKAAASKTVDGKPADPKTEPPKPNASPKPSDLVKDWSSTPGFIDYYRKEEKSFAQIKKADCPRPKPGRGLAPRSPMRAAHWSKSRPPSPSCPTRPWPRGRLMSTWATSTSSASI